MEYLPTFTYSKCTSPMEHMGYYGPIESTYHFPRISLQSTEDFKSPDTESLVVWALQK